MAGRWVDVGEAARELGISTDAVRKRISRGSLDSDRPNGYVLVWLDNSRTEAGRKGQSAYDELLTSKDETISILRDQLQLRAEEIQRRDVIISQLTQATSSLTNRLSELETQDERNVTNDAQNESASVRLDSQQPSSTENESETQKSWWQKLFSRT